MMILVQTHRIRSTKSEPYIRYGPWVIAMYQHRSTEDGVCSHESKRRLLLRQKAMTNVDSIFKSRDITLLTKVCIVIGGLVTQSCLTLASTWTVTHQAPPSMGVSRQQYWSGMPLPSPLVVYGEFLSLQDLYSQKRSYRTLFSGSFEFLE